MGATNELQTHTVKLRYVPHATMTEYAWKDSISVFFPQYLFLSSASDPPCSILIPAPFLHRKVPELEETPCLPHRSGAVFMLWRILSSG